jgi:type II secretory pathway predicted ATPase ExeA
VALTGEAERGGAAEGSYLDFFGLAEPPFRPTADPRWVFPTPGYEAARTALARFLVGPGGIACVVGEGGTGKTLLLHHLRDAPPPGVRPFALLHPGLALEEIIESLALGTMPGLDRVPRSGAELAAHLADETAAGRTVALLVDEAQALAPEVVVALPGLADAGLRVVLAAQPAGAAKIEAVLPVARRVELHALAPDAVASYVGVRLARAGAARPDLFTAAALAHLARVTGGVPRLVNAIADASLAGAFITRDARIDVAHVKSAWRAHLRFTSSDAPVTPPTPDRPAPAPRRVPLDLLEPPTRATLGGAPRARRRLALPAGAIALGLVALAALRGLPRARAPEPTAAPVPSRAAEDAEATPPVQPAAADLVPTAAEALAVVDAFRRAYEARDPARLSALLAPDAVENGHVGGARVAQAHARLLAGLEDVAYLQPDARLRPRADGVEVDAPFVIRYRDRDGHAGELRGTEVWHIARRHGVARIVRLVRTVDADARARPD